MSDQPGWATIPLNDNHVHVVPLEDGLIHEPSDDCICGPKTEAITQDDGATSWLVIHEALDVRQ